MRIIDWSSDVCSSDLSSYAYQKTDYETLIDSPTIAGKYTKQFALSDRVFLDVVADTPDELKATPEQIDAHKRLVAQAVKTFGSQHHDNYHFMFTISDNLGGNGQLGRANVRTPVT